MKVTSKETNIYVVVIVVARCHFLGTFDDFDRIPDDSLEQ